MELQRLEIFLAIVSRGSVSAAAGQVHLTQPAVSRNLKLLEESLGVELFERRGRKMVLTPSGRALIPMAKEILGRVEAAIKATSEAAERRYFDLKLGTVDSVATYLLPRLTGPLGERFPELAIKIVTGRTRELLERLEADELDVVIAAWTGKPPSGRWRWLGPYAYHYFGRRDRFPLLCEVTGEEGLGDYPIIELEAMPGQPSLIQERSRSFAVAQSLASVKALVLGGFGVGGLLGFMLTEAEEALLHRAAVPHDAACGLYLVGAEGRREAMDLAIEDAAVEILREAFGAGRAAGEPPRGHLAEG